MAPSMESLSSRSSQMIESLCSGVTDAISIVHRPVPFPSSKTWKGILPRPSHFCHEKGVPTTGRWVRHACSTCNKAYCCPTAIQGSQESKMFINYTIELAFNVVLNGIPPTEFNVTKWNPSEFNVALKGIPLNLVLY